MIFNIVFYVSRLCLRSGMESINILELFVFASMSFKLFEVKISCFDDILFILRLIWNFEGYVPGRLESWLLSMLCL